MRPMKKLFVVVFLILALVAGGVWWFVNYRLDGMIAAEIENRGTQALGTAVTVGDVRTDLRGGALFVADLAVANPPGYARQHAVTFGHIEAALDYESLEISRVVLEEARIFIEEKDGRINVQEIEDALEARLAAETGSEAADETEIAIERFLMRGTTATFESASLQRLSEVEIDDVELRKLRGTPEEVAGVIASKLMEEIAEEAGRELLRARTAKQLEDVERKISDKLREMLDDDG